MIGLVKAAEGRAAGVFDRLVDRLSKAFRRLSQSSELVAVVGACCLRSSELVVFGACCLRLSATGARLLVFGACGLILADVSSNFSGATQNFQIVKHATGGISDSEFSLLVTVSKHMHLGLSGVLSLTELKQSTMALFGH